MKRAGEQRGAVQEVQREGEPRQPSRRRHCRARTEARRLRRQGRVEGGPPAPGGR